MSNSLDPDQARRFVGPDLGPKLFAMVISRRQKSPLTGKELIFQIILLTHLSLETPKELKWQMAKSADLYQTQNVASDQDLHGLH